MSEINWSAVKGSIHEAVAGILADAEAGHYDVSPVVMPQPDPAAPPVPTTPTHEYGEQGTVNPYGSASGIPATDNPYAAPTSIVAPPVDVPVLKDVPLSPEAKGLRVVASALRQQGKRYGWGGTGPDTFDCSGLSQWAYRDALGIEIGRTTYDQVKGGREVKFSEAIDGDLIFSNFNSSGQPGHVSINMSGPDNVIEAGDPVGIYKWGVRGKVIVKRYT